MPTTYLYMTGMESNNYLFEKGHKFHMFCSLNTETVIPATFVIGIYVEYILYMCYGSEAAIDVDLDIFIIYHL